MVGEAFLYAFQVVERDGVVGAEAGVALAAGDRRDRRGLVRAERLAGALQLGSALDAGLLHEVGALRASASEREHEHEQVIQTAVHGFSSTFKVRFLAALYHKTGRLSRG